MPCFCGCDRKISFGMRSLNKRGGIIRGDVRTARAARDQGMKSPNAEAFISDAEAVLAALADAVHAGVDPGPELEAQSRDFMAVSRQFGEAALGAAIARSGLSGDEAFSLLANGSWDPFADAVLA